MMELKDGYVQLVLIDSIRVVCVDRTEVSRQELLPALLVCAGEIHSNDNEDDQHEGQGARGHANRDLISECGSTLTHALLTG